MTDALKLARNLELPVDAVRAASARLWRGIDQREPDECWPWVRSCNSDGYGHIRIAGRLTIATRAVFLLVNGWLPPLVMHRCDNPPCCNPRHLIGGTKALNNADKMEKGRFRPAIGDSNGMRQHPERASRGDAHYARQHPELLARGEQHGNAKITASQVAEMRRLFAAGGRTKISIAREFGIGQSQIGRILSGEAWR